MRRVTYAMNLSLDGFVMDSSGSIDWSVPSDELFQFSIDQLREVGVHLLGRRLYETMLYWETADQDPTLSAARLEWAALWRALPKVVFSRTLAKVQGTATRLATTSLADEIARLKAEPAEGDIAIGGADLAHQAAELDLIDEYRPRIAPVLIGDGVPYFASGDRKVRLELLETRTFDGGFVHLRQRVVRDPT